MSEAFSWITPKRGGNSGHSGTNEGVLLSFSDAGKNKRQFTMRIYTKTMQKMRWVAGDRVQVGVDINGSKIAVRRIPTGGYSLSPSGTKKEERERNVGKSISSTIKMTAPDTVELLLSDTLFIPLSDCIDQDGILVLPIGAAE